MKSNSLLRYVLRSKRVTPSHLRYSVNFNLDKISYPLLAHWSKKATVILLSRGVNLTK